VDWDCRAVLDVADEGEAGGVAKTLSNLQIQLAASRSSEDMLKLRQAGDSGKEQAEMCAGWNRKWHSSDELDQ